MKKAIVLFSSGLDSRLAVKIMQEQGFKVIGVYFKLPFSKDESKNAKTFAKKHNFKLKILDCTKGKLLDEYIEKIKKAKHGKGTSLNPCKDCRIFLLKKTKEIADKKNIDLIVTGEVLDERPMSQTKKSIRLVDKETGLKERLLRPLSAKLLEKTEAEKKELVKRRELYSIKGKSRKKQLKLAEKFNIKAPTPGGGCLLCEKELKKRFEFLLKRGLNKKVVELLNTGRHFLIDGYWIVLGRNERENQVLEKIGNKKNLMIPDYPAPTAIILNSKKNKKIKNTKEIKEKIKELIKAYSKKGSLKEKEKFEKYKI